MKNIIVLLIAAISSVFIVNYFVLAFTEPTSPPPADNVPAPINVGGGRQIKSGDLTVQNLKATSITLGEDTRFGWPDGVGGSGAVCAWEGWKCDCRSDGSTFADVRLTIGVQCAGGQLSDMRILNVAVSSASKRCGKTPPGICNPALYTYQNNTSGGFFNSVGDFFGDLF